MRIIFLFIAVFTASIGHSQIVDDSTQLVYGPKTTTYITENQLLNNQVAYQNVDTSIYRFERQSFYDRSGRKYQDLGNFGTAMYPIFYTPQQLFGRTSGYNAYSRYAFQPSDIKYYDTKSPFIDLLVYLGGGNRNLVDVGFSRNVNKDWNLGFDVRKITTNKQLAPQNQTDRLVVGTSFSAYTHYKHSKLPYQVLASYSSMKHQAVEQGGARPTTDSLRTDFFLFDNALVRLDGAQSIVKISRWHLYQDVKLADQFQLYHTLDYLKESNIYKDQVTNVGPGGYDYYRDYYDQFLIDPDTTNNLAELKAFSNEVGWKGEISNVFYRFYARLRSIKWRYLYYNPGENTLEKYLGGYARFTWKEKFYVSANAEYLVGGEYQFGGTLTSDLITASYTSMKFVVPFVYSDYFGNHHEWQNNFAPVFTNNLKGQINLDFKRFEIRPKISLSTYDGLVYFDEQIEARQARDPVLISSIGGDFNLRFLNEKKEGWHLENEVLATNVSGAAADKVRVPNLYFNGRYFWRGNWFEDMIPVEFGVDAHARSAYFANAYAPEIQQFYLQNDQEIFGYLAADVFVNMRVDKFFFSLKWTHANQPRDDGYFVTPNYPGQPKVIDLIIRWMFFD